MLRSVDNEKDYIVIFLNSHDKVLARSNYSKTSETHQRQDDIFGYELQFQLLYLEYCQYFNRPSELSKVTETVFLSMGGLREDNLCDT